ncbi:MAG: hypothetical protein JWR32_836 [Mycobacterium sp.]|jgi:hypothetical protein|nr:hypothetical protein [Mycobacterium sp.]
MYPRMPEKTTQPWANWQTCEEVRGTQALAQLAERLPAFFADSLLAHARCSDARINELRRDTYRSARASLQANRALLDHVAAALQDKQELSGKELRRLAEPLGKADAPKK